MKKITLPLIIAALSVATSAAHAADTTSNGGILTITGALTGNTCDISGNGQANNFSVTLPTLSASNLADPGSSTGSTGFNIALSNCMSDTGMVHTFWEYGSNTLPDGNLLNTGTAQNVEVQLVDYNNGENVIDVSKADGTQGTQSVNITAGSATLKYAARYVSPVGAATAGTVSTQVTYSLVYQ